MAMPNGGARATSNAAAQVDFVDLVHDASIWYGSAHAPHTHGPLVLETPSMDSTSGLRTI